MPETTYPDIRERVARGVALLDEKRPGWWQHIAVDDLDINDCTECVIGQLFALDDAAYGREPFEAGALALIGLGFSVPRSDDDTEADVLTVEWRRVISERCAGQSAIPLEGGA